jgi:hypothetical protein
MPLEARLLSAMHQSLKVSEGNDLCHHAITKAKLGPSQLHRSTDAHACKRSRRGLTYHHDRIAIRSVAHDFDIAEQNLGGRQSERIQADRGHSLSVCILDHREQADPPVVGWGRAEAHQCFVRPSAHPLSRAIGGGGAAATHRGGSRSRGSVAAAYR